ncbi:MAG TPA: molecular chaperone DnaJ, partial [Candidatus Limnocylindrales bacterium]|nr:molecular chaperone DnaJ [Candidatus Limnocylindrales bacterium]
MATQQKRDYYEVLGLERNATQEQIKQAYRQLALKWHPDRNTAPEATDRFKEVAEAYAVLSDQAKRAQYDATGHAGVSERWSTEDLFRDFEFGDFFGGRMGDLWSVFGDFFPGRGARTSARPQGADLRYDLHLSLEQAARGGEQLIKLTRSDRCKTCNGSGAKPGTKPVTCSDCRGTGEMQQVRADKTMRVVTLTTCTRCKGRGMFIESPCSACKGAGLQFLPHSIKVQIPAGVEHGMLLRLAGQGEGGPQDAPPGDLLVRIYIQPHPTLRRDGDDLYAAITISFPDAALGTKVTVACLEDEKVIITVPPGSQHGTLLRARGKGMPRLHG